MHQHCARIVGGALNLADKIMDGTYTNGCHLGGGLHHALAGRANGFVYITMLLLQPNI